MSKYKYPPKMIKAMKQLQEHYILQSKGFETEPVGCLLCEVIGNTIASLLLCGKCPWVIETGKTCIEAQKKWNITALRNGGNIIPKQTLTKWRKRRTKELNEWIGE